MKVGDRVAIGTGQGGYVTGEVVAVFPEGEDANIKVRIDGHDGFVCGDYYESELEVVK